MINPFDITIQNQADDEKIIRIWRHHPLTLVGPAAKSLAFLAVPLLLFIFTGPSMFGGPFLFVLFVIILAIALTVSAYEWVSWYGDVYILTNYRIIDVEQRGFFHRNFAETTLNNIQDISHEVSGVFQTLFNFGSVLVQTAGSVANITLDDVSNPQQQAVYMLKYQQRYLKDHDDTMSADKLIKLLAKHGKRLDEIAKLEQDEKVRATEEQVEKAEKAANRPRRKRRL